MLTYTLTADDLKRALRASRQRTGSYRIARRFRATAAVALVGSMLLYALALALGGHGPGWQEIAIAVALVVTGGVGVWSRSRALRDLAAYHGQVVASVDSDGIHTSRERGTSTTNWSTYGSYVETPEAFVLVARVRRPHLITVLPKRALTDRADIDRLRSILTDHLPSE